jgi:hypothetical protein
MNRYLCGGRKLLGASLLVLVHTAAAAVECQLNVGNLQVRVSAAPQAIEIEAYDGAQLMARMDVPVEGALSGCWQGQLQARQPAALVVASAAGEPGQPADLRAWVWTGSWFSPVPITPLRLPIPLVGTPVEDVQVLAGALLRSVGSAHYRYDFPTQAWVAMAAPPPGANTGRATAGPDALLQAPRHETQ